MDEKINELLIQEINKGVKSLEHDKEQLIEELKKYEGRPELPEKIEFQQNLNDIDTELEEKRMEIATVNTRKEIIVQIQEEQEKLEKEYKSLIKEKQDCEAELDKISGKMQFVDGKLTDSNEKKEYEKDLEKINTSIAQLKKAKAKLEIDLEDNSAVIENLVKKYKIREKSVDELSNPKDTSKETNTQSHLNESIAVEGPEQDVNPGMQGFAKTDRLKSNDLGRNNQEEPRKPYVSDPEDKIIKIPKDPELSKAEEKPNEDKSKNDEEIKIEGLDAPKTIETISCTVKDGKLYYIISGIDEANKKYTSETEIIPEKLSKEERKDIMKTADRYSIRNVDPQIYRILKHSSFFKNTDLQDNYIEQIKRLSSLSGKEKEDDIFINYDLENLNLTKLNMIQKSRMKNIARNNYIEGIAEYSKPKSKFKFFMEKLKRKLLPEKNPEKIETNKPENTEILTKDDKNMTRSDRIYYTYKDLSKEEGFDFDKFCEDMELTEEERKELEVYEKVNSQGKEFHKKMQNSVDYKDLPKTEEQKDSSKAKDTIEKDEQSL